METEKVAAEVPAQVPAQPPAEKEENKEPTTCTDPHDDVTDNKKEKAATEAEGESSEVMDNPACDWLEPLEEDCEDVDGQSFDRDGTGDAELESLAGSEWSGSVTSRRNVGERGGRGGGAKPRRRRHFEPNENWEDWPILGQGWKRRQVFRRSGTSEGRSDTYYMSRNGQKVRSKVELLKYVDESLDLSNFDFKSGKLVDGVPRRRRKRFVPYLNQKDADATPPKSSPHTYPVTDVTPTEPTANPVAPPSGEGLVNGNGETSQSSFRVCERCNKTFSVEEGQSICQSCRRELNASIDRRRKPNKKWIPCGRCRACQITVDCGKCVSCRNSRLHHQLNVRSRKVKCRKRKCLHPIRRDKVAKGIPQASKKLFLNTASLDTPYFKPPGSDFEESQSSFLQYSDSEDLSLFLGNDGDSYMDEFGLAKVRRRSCGCCRGCIRRTDCGTCDFCMDKPKFGGRNKKRQKCRLRQCQREAMKHLLPMDESQTEMYIPQDWVIRGRPRTRGRPRSRKQWDLELSDNEAEQYERPKTSGAAHMGNRKAFLFPSYNGKRPGTQYKELPAAKYENSTFPLSYVGESFRPEKRSQTFAMLGPYQEQQHESESSPSITQIFSMADSATKGIDADHELMPLLKSLRSMVLPVLWFCIVAEGPRLQLMQCSKRSAMADTIVNIEPSFQYHISVQGQPLLPTHKLYDIHPTRLTTTTEIVALLEDLERHSVCLGFENKNSRPGPLPVLPERAATCDFLILPELERCAKCSTKPQHHV
ncbi:methyl-CpG-binding domain protein 1b isoform X1 [Triplophysa rosa]|nr:methyl-CpG-binding domain protein 1b isoform X1 [Triplophysa rosa]XP_057217936.1 methyl-CpG-binding domain protein 1b isoform X1 [Triplophysa rosa]